MKAVAAALVVASSALVAGCGGGDTEPEATSTITVTEMVTSRVSSTPPTEGAKPATPATPALGEKVPTPWGSVQAVELNPNVPGDAQIMEDLNYERWAGLLVRSCVDQSYDEEPVKLSWAPWSLTDRKGGNFLSLDLSGGVSFPEPVYPQFGDRTTRPGTCTQGWIVFDVTADARLAEVVYESESVPEPIVWSLTK